MRKVPEQDNLQVIHPALAAQGRPTKDPELTPRNVTPQFHMRAWWICPRGHEWDARIKLGSLGNGWPVPGTVFVIAAMPWGGPYFGAFGGFSHYPHGGLLTSLLSARR